METSNVGPNCSASETMQRGQAVRVEKQIVVSTLKILPGKRPEDGPNGFRPTALSMKQTCSGALRESSNVSFYDAILVVSTNSAVGDLLVSRLYFVSE